MIANDTKGSCYLNMLANKYNASKERLKKKRAKQGTN